MIAEHLGTGPGTAAKHLFDARADSKKALREWVIADDRAGTLLAGEEAP